MHAPSLRTIGCILDLPAQVHAAWLRLRRLGAEGSAHALEELALVSRSGHPADGAALLACALALIEEDQGWCDAIHAAALRTGATVVASMLAGGIPPHKRMPRRGRLPDTGALAHASIPPRWRDAWRTHPWVRARVAQLGRHPSALVLRRLLRDPTIMPEDAVRIAARRPIIDALVRELTSHRPTIALSNVRLALVANPFTPTGVALSSHRRAARIFG